MGRLIDEDVLLARISLNYNNHQNISAGAMKDIINTTPTAYDISKVVAELEDLQCVNPFLTTTEYEHKAIEIARKGGAE